MRIHGSTIVNLEYVERLAAAMEQRARHHEEFAARWRALKASLLPKCNPSIEAPGVGSDPEIICKGSPSAYIRPHGEPHRY